MYQRVGGYHRLTKESKGDQVGKGVLFEAGGSQRRVTGIGVGQYCRLFKGSKMDLVWEGVSAVDEGGYTVGGQFVHHGCVGQGGLRGKCACSGFD